MQEVLVLEHPLRVVDRDGTTYHVRVWAHPEADGRWSGFLEFIPTGGGPRERTGHETKQRSSADVGHWAGALGPLYLEGALERAHHRSGVDRETAPILIHTHETVVTSEGRSFRARTWGLREPSGGFIAWIEFAPQDGSGPALSTGHETSQSDLEALTYWAHGLSPIYLEGALSRARSAGGGSGSVAP